MLARTRIIEHPSGSKMDTPILVPSFSSKGFRVAKNHRSEINKLIGVAKEFITESLLVSAYDIKHYKLNAENLSCAQFVFIDSGGYELYDDFDLATHTVTYNKKENWNKEEYTQIANKLPSYLDLILVTYDHPKERKDLTGQIQDANTLISNHEDKVVDVLIKPSILEDPFLNIDEIEGNINSLCNFRILGFTEKELGPSVIKRMTAIHRIRSALNKKGAATAIHVFGSLDPISSVLYYLVGADIFDGLTWLKFAYHNGYTLYKQDFGVIEKKMGIQSTLSQIEGSIIPYNIQYLSNLKYAMVDLLKQDGFRCLSGIMSEEVIQSIQLAYDRFTSNIK